MVETRLDFSAFDRAADKLDSLFGRPTNFTARPAQEWMSETGREQFRSEGAAGASGPWDRLSPMTERRKRKLYGDRPILQASGEMERMLTQSGSLRALMAVTDDKVVFRLPPPSVFHQRGTRRMPQRKVVDPSDRQKEGLRERVRKETVGQVRRLGIKVEEKGG